MAKFVLIAVLFIFIGSISTDASEGHNGILFNMTQKQVEGKGFVCNPPEEKSDTTIAVCNHIDMTGIAFGYPTKDYEVRIGPSKKVDTIRASFSGEITSDQYFDLHSRIPLFFPKKDEAATDNNSKYYECNEWRAKNNSSARLCLFYRPKTSMGICFFSPRAQLARDKKQNNVQEKNEIEGDNK
jgi:hypothetical protein